MKAYLNSIGCRLNEAEVESWASRLQTAGYQIVKHPEAADLMVFNSCAVTQASVRKSRQQIRRLRRDNPKAKLVVTGCYSTLHPEQVATQLDVDLVVDNRNKRLLPELTQRKLQLPKAPRTTAGPGPTSLFQRGRQRAFVKVQDGCRHRCTYCVVTIARGQERSRSAQAIIAEINQLHAQGLAEVVLTGVHVGGYGRDLGTSLYRLLEQILAETTIPRIRLASVEPWDLSAEFFRLFSNPRLMPHLHLPLQSGSDSVLKRMARRGRTEDFRQLVHTATSLVTDFAVTTDIIVGFPGETASDWQATLAFVAEMKFPHIHIFNYSKRSGTKAADFAEQVPGAIKKQRMHELHNLALHHKREYLKSYLGKSQPVLWEGWQQRAAGVAGYFGYTPNMLRVFLPTPEKNLEAQIIATELTGIAENGQYLIGKIDSTA